MIRIFCDVCNIELEEGSTSLVNNNIKFRCISFELVMDILRTRLAGHHCNDCLLKIITDEIDRYKADQQTKGFKITNLPKPNPNYNEIFIGDPEIGIVCLGNKDNTYGVRNNEIV